MNQPKYIWNKNLIHYCLLNENPSAIYLLEKYPEKIDQSLIWFNPNIFTYDYERMICPFKEELLALIYHPDNIQQFYSILN